MVCDENNARKRRGSGRTDPADHPPFFVGILYNPSEEKAVPGRREIDSEYGEDVSRLPLFTNRPDPGCVRNVKTVQRISSSSWGSGGQAVRMEEKDLAFLKQVCGEQLDQPMGLSQVEADEEGNLIRVEGILRPYSQKIVRKRLRKRYVLAEVGLFGRQETVLFGICLPGDRIWEGRR